MSQQNNPQLKYNNSICQHLNNAYINNKCLFVKCCNEPECPFVSHKIVSNTEYATREEYEDLKQTVEGLDDTIQELEQENKYLQEIVDKQHKELLLYKNKYGELNEKNITGE